MYFVEFVNVKIFKELSKNKCEHAQLIKFGTGYSKIPSEKCKEKLQKQAKQCLALRG